jgi:glycosyltransferase involved in cell wall biosynthesis
MIAFDSTKSAAARHHSGLQRVSARLRAELGSAVREVQWKRQRWADLEGKPVALGKEDWLLTPELFSEEERPGFWSFLRQPPCRTAAIFHDAIPLRLPHVTWPKSVARHPEYMKMLAQFDQVFAVSRASAEELQGFWRWQGVQGRSEVVAIALGADIRAGAARAGASVSAAHQDPAEFLCVGIIEPRKNQGMLLEVAERLARKGVRACINIVGRTNPHFGEPIARRLRSASGRLPTLRLHDVVDDAALLTMWSQCRATLFPTLAEGCGLPLLESLWMGVPCVCSDLPVLRENASGGGCVPLAVGDLDTWTETLERLATDAHYYEQLRADALARTLPTWSQTAAAILAQLGVRPTSF